jgi:arylsulfatase A-like enzyme
MKRLGIDRNSSVGVHVSECGFEPFERDDGLHPTRPGGPRPKYDQYLKEKGYGTENPWELHANSGRAEDGSVRNGWMLMNSDAKADISEEDSETPYMTRRAMEFIAGAKDDARPWCLHLSYIKPHWPYVAPAPYNDMYGRQHVIRAVREEAERADPHPVFKAFMEQRVGKNFSKDEVRETVIPAYMGLIKQIDDQLGVLFRFLEEQGLADSTMIVFTSDHGDYLGDHWLGEKDLFHDCSAKVPLLIYDPLPEANVTRGTVCDRLVEAIDLAPSFVEYFGGAVKPHVMEGRSLLPLLRGEAPSDWRDFAFSEYDYSMLEARQLINRAPGECRLFMVFDGRWKMIHAPGMRPMLYDLETDPREVVDLGADPAFEAERQRLTQALFDWALKDHNRITMSDAQIAAYGPARQLANGIVIGYVDEEEVAAARKEWGLT